MLSKCSGEALLCLGTWSGDIASDEHEEYGECTVGDADVNKGDVINK